VAVKCPSCHSDNTDTARFCSNCATALITAAATPTPTPSPPPHPRSFTQTLESPAPAPAHAVAPGTVLSARYEILGKIGQGGMGEVHRALDRNLGRHVAIKVLPAAVADDAERLARFEREARLLAVLNHPHVAAIHGLEEFEGRRFIVMELVEGEALKMRLDRGPLETGEAMDLCRQIAEGLEAAHDKGIVHRDLKPGNILITPEGAAKILDFGLAKAYAGETTGVDIANSPTITARMTEPGVILGTAAYMSPEQARGRPVDKRADIWAFGCVLYECLTGKRPFQGDTVSDTLAQILKGEPDWTALPADTPPNIAALLRRCLQKNPRNRLHDIADARIEIEDAHSWPLSEVRVGRSKPYHFKWIFVVGIAAIMIASSIGIIIGRKSTIRAGGPIVRTTIELPPGTQLTRRDSEPGRTQIVFAPDGRSIVFSASSDGTWSKAMLYRRSLDSNEANPIPYTEGAISPFISPDGKWIGFWAREKVFKISSSGGIPVELFSTGIIHPFGMCWDAEGRIFISKAVSTGLSVLSPEGDVKELTKPDLNKEYSHRLPFVLPGGKALCFTVMPFSWGASAWIEVLDLRSGERKVLIEDGADARYVPTGHIVFARRGTLMAAPFDLDRLSLTAPPVPIMENLLQSLNTANNRDNSGSGQYSFSNSGALLYASGGISPDQERQLRLVDRRGNFNPLTEFGSRPAGAPRISPDGKRIVYATHGMDRKVWIYDIDKGTSAMVSSEGQAMFPNWTPDGKRLAFSWSKGGPLGIWWKALEASAAIEPLATSGFNLFPGSWTQDGRYLSIAESHPETLWNILYFDMKEQKLHSFNTTEANEQWPDFAPGGRWLAYVSDKSGRPEVYIRSFPDGDREIVVSNNGGTSPLWSPDGKELFYWDLKATRIMKVEVGTQPDFSVGTPAVTLQLAGLISNPIRGYDITPDGREFLVSAISQPGHKPVEVTQLNLVLNWFEELKRLAPPGK
jgi:serine/threonine protein kinase/WD40 repeat protein